jgi:Phage tail lysozyme
MPVLQAIKRPATRRIEVSTEAALVRSVMLKLSVASPLESALAKVAAIAMAIFLALYGLHHFQTAPPPDLSTARARETYIFEFWKDRGLNDVQASALVGNFLGETREDDLLDPSTVGGWRNEAFGIEQCLGERKANLFKFAKEEGVDLVKSPLVDRLRVENEFAYHEFQTTETRAWRQLINAKTIDSATDATAAFERWRGWKQGQAGAEAGTHYRWAHVVYRLAQGGAFNKTEIASR